MPELDPMVRTHTNAYAIPTDASTTWAARRRGAGAASVVGVRYSRIGPVVILSFGHLRAMAVRPVALSTSSRIIRPGEHMSEWVAELSRALKEEYGDQPHVCTLATVD